MKPNEKKKLRKIIEKHYYKHHQTLYFTSLEVFDNKSCELDIYLCDEKGKNLGQYLFEIRNYTAFYDLNHSIQPYNSARIIVIEFWDTVKASCSPYYFDRIFTLHTFKPLSIEDIENACRYFNRNILDNFLFNFKFIPYEESLPDKLSRERNEEIPKI